jgi:hypothetical protein
MHRWGFVESPACDCGAEEQTMRHIVDECPLRLFADGLTMETMEYLWSVEDRAFQRRLSCPVIDQFIFHQSHVKRNPHQLHLNSVLAQAPPQLFTFIHHKVSPMRNSSRHHSFDRTQAISGNKTPLRRPYNLSNVS